MASLLTSRRFAPLFATQFLGAFNDNLYKTAMLFLITYRLMSADLTGAATLVTVAGGVFILPFFPFSALAGQIADALDKAQVARWVKTAEIAIMAVGALALTHDSIPLLMLVLFLMGLHSTIFGPFKYAILPQHLAPGELLGGTGLVEGGTFVAILLAQILGGLLAPGTAAIAVLVVAIIGSLTARLIPPAPPLGSATIDWNPLTSSRAVLAQAFANRQVRTAIIAISWFWALGAVYTSAFIPLVKGALGASETVATLFLTAFSIGIATGSIGVTRLLKGRVSGGAAPWAALGLALFSTDLYFAIGAMPPPTATPLTVAGIFAEPAGWRVLADLFGLAVAGGVFSVPLYAILQTASEQGSRSRAVAANNIVNSAFMVAAALLAATAVSQGVPVRVVLLATGLTALPLLPLLFGLRYSTRRVLVKASATGPTE
ncbi:MFS transporter [Glacieibacterium sp.]|uniref:MFS transporter n=1 Tax=Glacieibacterium sp. TaxID=2860237 RepID=UPI003B002551